MEVNPDGTFKAQVKIGSGLPDGKYSIVAVADKDLKSQPLSFENKIGFPTVYLSNAGTSINLFWPFLLTLAIAIFGVLMGAGGRVYSEPASGSDLAFTTQCGGRDRYAHGFVLPGHGDL